MIAAWLLHPDRSSFSLEKLTEAKLLLETISFDSIVPKGKNFTDVPLETAVKYGSEDADFTWQLWQIFEKELKENNLFSLFTDLEMPVLPILAQMERQGIHLEKSELAEYSKDLTSQIEKILGAGMLYMLKKFFGIILLAISVKLFTSNLSFLIQSVSAQ